MATLRKAPNTNEEKIEKLESLVASDAKEIAYLTTLEKGLCLTSLCGAAETTELRGKVIGMKGEIREAVSSAEQHWAKVSTMSEKQHSLVVKCKELALEI